MCSSLSGCNVTALILASYAARKEANLIRQYCFVAASISSFVNVELLLPISAVTSSMCAKESCCKVANKR